MKLFLATSDLIGCPNLPSLSAIEHVCYRGAECVCVGGEAISAFTYIES